VLRQLPGIGATLLFGDLACIGKIPGEVEKMTVRLEPVEGVNWAGSGVDSDANADTVEAFTPAALGIPGDHSLTRKEPLNWRPTPLKWATAISLALRAGYTQQQMENYSREAVWSRQSSPRAEGSAGAISDEHTDHGCGRGVYTGASGCHAGSSACAVQVDSAYWRGAGYHLLA